MVLHYTIFGLSGCYPVDRRWKSRADCIRQRVDNDSERLCCWDDDVRHVPNSQRRNRANGRSCCGCWGDEIYKCAKLFGFVVLLARVAVPLVFVLAILACNTQGQYQGYRYCYTVVLVCMRFKIVYSNLH